MQGQGAPDILGVGCGDILFFQVKPSFSYFFEGVFSRCALLIAFCFPMLFRVLSYRDKFPSFDRHPSGLSKRDLGVRTKAHTDAFLRNRMCVEKKPEL